MSAPTPFSPNSFEPVSPRSSSNRTDQRLIQGILEIHQNPRLKDLWTTEVALNAAKEYYTCAKLDIPPEIAQIMNGLPPVPEERCSLPE